MRLYQAFVLVTFSLGYVSGACCPEGWLASATSCYLFVRGHESTFSEAEHYCRQHHDSHLVEVETEAENLFLRDYMRGVKAEEHWLGITDERTEGIWRWYNGDTVPSYTDWFPGQPGSDGGDEDCGVFWYQQDYRWGDVVCTAKLNPICEIKEASEIVVG